MVYIIQTVIKLIIINSKSYVKHMLLNFTIKLNGGAYQVCTSPNMRRLENYFQHVL